MKYITLFILFISLQVQAQQKIIWPHQHKAVIVLTYDDALESQLKVAVPQLLAAHLKATFFLTAEMDTLTIPKWRSLSKLGYELGNHTIYHPCLTIEDNPVHSETYTIESMLREIEIMNNYLYAVDGHTQRTYAYPCSEATAGGKDYVDSLRDYALVKYARTGGDTDDAVITDFARLDLLRVPSYGLEGNNTANDLIAFVQKVEKAGGMGIFMFHGVGGDYLSVSSKAHHALLKYLNENKQAIWVTTFQQAMDYATSKVKAKPEILASAVKRKKGHTVKFKISREHKFRIMKSGRVAIAHFPQFASLYQA